MHAAQEQPMKPGFWGQRTGWTLLKQVLLLEPLPGGSRWAAAFGSLLLFAFVLQVITGVLLAMNYAPSVDSAYPSVRFIQCVESVWLSMCQMGMNVTFLPLRTLAIIVWCAFCAFCARKVQKSMSKGYTKGGCVVLV